MHPEKTWLTPKEAGEIIGMTGRNITNLIKKGKINAERDVDGRYYIDKSEFYRVYPYAIEREKAGSDEKIEEIDQVKFLEEKINHLQQLLDERKKHNGFLEQQINSITEEKSKMLEAINSHARLLEHKESVSKLETTEASIIDLKKPRWRRLFKKP